jgi:exodeoxyribonuclease VII small subunit
MAKVQSFEKAMEKLEQIVDTLESDNPSLETALKKFEEGIKLSKLCSARLDEMEQRITVLMENATGGIEEKPMNAVSGETSPDKPV